MNLMNLACRLNHGYKTIVFACYVMVCNRVGLMMFSLIEQL